MKSILPFFLLFFLTFNVFSQDDGRVLLRGQVLYRQQSVPNENVINSTNETATITNDRGEFAIYAKAGDDLVFTAVNYQLMVVTITQDILKNNRLVVEVNEKVTQLEEVVVTPEDQERFIQLKNEQLKQYEYEIDRSTEVENITLSQTERGMKNGVNFVNIFRALLKSVKGNEVEEERKPLKMSEVLRLVYDNQFFVADLKLPQDKIDAFLIFCDDKVPTQSLLRKENEFQLIDFLVTQSEAFLKEMDDQK